MKLTDLITESKFTSDDGHTINVTRNDNGVTITMTDSKGNNASLSNVVSNMGGDAADAKLKDAVSNAMASKKSVTTALNSVTGMKWSNGKQQFDMK